MLPYYEIQVFVCGGWAKITQLNTPWDTNTNIHFMKVRYPKNHFRVVKFTPRIINLESEFPHDPAHADDLIYVMKCQAIPTKDE